MKSLTLALLALLASACAAPVLEPRPGPAPASTPGKGSVAIADAAGEEPSEARAEAPLLWPADALVAARSKPQPALRTAVAASGGSSPSAIARSEDDALRARLRETLLPGLALDGAMSLREALKFLSAASGVNIFVDRLAQDTVEAGESIQVDIDRPVSVENALSLIAELAGDDVAWTVRDGIVLLTSPERARAEPRVMIFEVSDLVRSVPSYPGVEVDVAPSGGLERSAEDLQERGPTIDEGRLVELVRSALPPDIRDADETSISIQNGKLIVRHR